MDVLQMEMNVKVFHVRTTVLVGNKSEDISATALMASMAPTVKLTLMTVRPVPVRIMAVVLIWLMITNALAVCRDTLERNVTQKQMNVLPILVRTMELAQTYLMIFTATVRLDLMDQIVK